MGLGEVALRLDVTPRQARTITTHDDFPQPCARVAAGRRIWLAEDVEAWISEYRPGLEAGPQ